MRAEASCSRRQVCKTLRMEPEQLWLKRVTKTFPGAAGDATVAVLKDVDLHVAGGESLAIVGPSGSGKSTLLHIIGALERPTSGTVKFNGKEITGLSNKDLAVLRNQAFGFVFQAHYLLPQCTVLENVLVPTLAAPAAGISKSSEPAPARAERLLKRVGLDHRLHHRPAQLSGGERQRTAVVRALINNPKLLLADEPTGSLDPASASELGNLLIELNKEEGVTLIVVTHAVSLAQKMGRALELRERQLVQASLANITAGARA